MELYPFRISLNENIDMIMVGHIALPGLDRSGRAASHSYTFTSELLRNELGFDASSSPMEWKWGGLPNQLGQENPQ